MKWYLGRFFLFFTPFLVILVILYFSISWFVRNQMKQHTFPASVTCLAMGDSHIQTALCDSLYPGLRNIAQTNEAYVYTYYKLKYLTQSNPQIDTLFLGVAPHNFSAYYDVYLTQPDLSANYFWILPPVEQFTILCRMDHPITYLMGNIWRELTQGGVSGNDTLWLGNWHPVSNRMDPHDPKYIARIESQFYLVDQVTPRSRFNRYWLEQIIHFCRDRKIVLIMIDTPAFNAYRELVPPSYNNYMKNLAMHYDLPILEVSFDHSNPDFFLPDGDHLTQEGAIIYTRMLYQKLQINH
jgi:hypothetical protein